MSSRFDQFIENQRKQAANIREEALNGTLEVQPKTQVSKSSRSDVFKANYGKVNSDDAITTDQSPVDNSKGDYKMSDLIPKYESAKPLNLINGVKFNTPTRPSVESKPTTEYEKRKQELEEANYPKPMKAVIGSLDKFFFDNPVGKFISRVGSTPDAIMSGGNPVTIRPELGPTANKVADVLGTGLAMGVPSGAPIGSGTIAAPYNAVDNVIAASPKLQKAESAVANTLTAGGKIKPQTAQVITREVMREGTAGSLQGPAAALMMGQPDNKELAESALYGAVGGAAIGGAVPLVTQPIKSAVNNFRVGNALQKGIRNTELPVTPTPGRAVNAIDNTISAEKDALKQSWFTNLFGDQGLGISAVSGTGSNRMISTQDQIVNSAIRNDIKGLKDSAAAQARATYQNFVDYLSPLKKISNETYQSAMDVSRANSLANTIARDAFVTPEGQVVGESLQNIFKKVPRGQDEKFVDYLLLRHAETRMGREELVYDKSLNMTTDKVRERIEMLDKRYPGFQQIAKEWDQFNDNVLKYLGVNEGLISEDLYKALREQNPYYSPMRRQFSKSEKPGRNFISKTTSSSFSGQKAPIKEVSPTGSTRKIVDPRKTTIETIGAWTNASMRNRTMQSIVNAIKRDPEGMKAIAEIVKAPGDKRNLRDILLNDGIDNFVEALDSDFKSIFKTTNLSNDNVVRAMVDGQPVHIQIHDPEVVKTLIGMGPQASNALVDFMSVLSNATKRGATGVFAPVFAVKGATMDLVQSAIQSKNPAQQMAYTVYGIISGIADRLNIPGLRNMSQEFRRAGGGYSFALKGERQLNKTINDMTRYPLLTPKGVAKATKKAVSSPFQALEAIGDIAENAPRMAAFKLEMNRLGGERTPENIRKAMEQAREITINFSRKGALSRDIESFVPYNNAAVQGTYRIMRAFKENPARTMTAIAGLSVLPKIYEYVQFGDDPDYQKLPARERYRFLIVGKNSDGSFIKVPMEPAYNSFGELTIEALRGFKDQDPRAFKGMADALADVWLPPAATGALQGITQGGGAGQSIVGAINSTVAAPLVAVSSNQSFTGSPIVPKRLEGNSPAQQYDERTSSIAKKIGDKIGMSPMKVDYLIRSYGGDPARLLLPLTSDVGAGNTRNTVLRNFIVDPVFTNTLSEDFYAMKEMIAQAENDNRSNNVELPSWYDKKISNYVTNQKKSGISKKLSTLNGQKRNIQADKTLSAEDKSQKLRDVQRQINEIYLEAVTKMQESGIPLKGR